VVAEEDYYGDLLKGEIKDILERDYDKGEFFAPIRRMDDYINDYEMRRDEEGDERDYELKSELEIQPLEPIGGEMEIAAVDASLAILGETDRGVVAAFRVAIAYSEAERPIEVYEYITHLTENSRLIYEKLSGLLGSQREYTGSLNRMPYRIMNLLERIAQRRACSQVKDGIILWDGSITRTMETTWEIYNGAFKIARRNNNIIISISKRSRLRLIDGRKITMILDDHPGAHLSHIHHLLPERIQRDLYGVVHVAKFREDGFTFRVDVVPIEGVSCCEAIRRLAGAASFVNGYPAALREAHIHAYFTRWEVVALQSIALDRFDLKPMDIFDVRTHILGPFR